MWTELQLTVEERQELKNIWLALWHERGEGVNKQTSGPEVADLWYRAVIDFLARKERLKKTNDSAD
jgi:hypothetical protein